MYCKKCGRQLGDAARFCKYCGAPIRVGENKNPGISGMSLVEEQQDPGFKDYKKAAAAENQIIDNQAIGFLVFALVCFIAFVIWSGSQLNPDNDAKNESENPKKIQETDTWLEESSTVGQETSDFNENLSEDIFTDCAGRYCFSSGAGGWSTELDLEKDGTFTGDYFDSNWGESGDGYDGTVYQCDFHGRFKNPEMIDEYTYKLELDYLETESEEGEEVIRYENGRNNRYVNSQPCGMEVGEEFFLYLPEAAVSGLPQYFVNWVSMPTSMDANSTEKLPFYGLYNVEGHYGFFRMDE